MLSAKHSLLESLMPKENFFKTGTFPEIRAHDECLWEFREHVCNRTLRVV